MIRQLLATVAATAATIGGTTVLVPSATADPSYPGDVPGMNYQASLGAPCDNYERFIFGRGPSGQAEACHFPPPNQFPAATTGYWVISYPLSGVQEIGAQCPGPQAAAQSQLRLIAACFVVLVTFPVRAVFDAIYTYSNVAAGSRNLQCGICDTVGWRALCCGS